MPCYHPVRRRPASGSSTPPWRSFGTRGYEATSLDAAGRRARRPQADHPLLLPVQGRRCSTPSIDRSAGRAGRRRSRRRWPAPAPGWDRVEAVIRSVFRLAVRRPELLGLLREVSRLGPAGGRPGSSDGPRAAGAAGPRASSRPRWTPARCAAPTRGCCCCSIYSTVRRGGHRGRGAAGGRHRALGGHPPPPAPRAASPTSAPRPPPLTRRHLTRIPAQQPAGEPRDERGRSGELAGDRAGRAQGGAVGAVGGTGADRAAHGLGDHVGQQLRRTTRPPAYQK